MVAHMGGDPLTVTLADWLQLDGDDDWRVALRSPGVALDHSQAALSAFELTDSQAVLLERVVTVSDSSLPS
jgi:hypothetical protein